MKILEKYKNITILENIIYNNSKENILEDEQDFWKTDQESVLIEKEKS